MTNIFLPSCEAGAVSAGATIYKALGSASGANVTTEANCQTTWRDAGTFSNMYCNVAANSTTATSTITYRVGAGNGNETISITSGSTGEFTDATHTDSVSAGNQVDYAVAAGSTGTSINVWTIGIQFAPTTTTNTINKLSCSGAFSDTSVNTTYFNPLIGALSSSTTEANSQYKNKATATLQNLYVYVSANTASVATVDSRIAGSNGNLTVSISSGATGAMEDTTHTDSISSGNLVNTAINSTVTTSVSVTNIAVDYLTTTAITHYFNGLATGNSNSASTNDFSITGQMAGNSESKTNLKTGIAFTSSNLEAYFASNSLASASTIYFRVGSANGNETISVTASTGGYYEDSTHTDSVSSSAEIDYQCVFNGAGTAVINTLGILANYTPPVTQIFMQWLPQYGS